MRLLLINIVVVTVPKIIAKSSIPKKSFTFCALMAILDPVNSTMTIIVALAAAVNWGFRDSRR